jgi:urate oxidase
LAKLAENHYGKSRVRLVKVTRDGDTHHLYEWSVGVYLTGDFTDCFVAGDNTGLLATDTMKNTVYAVARSSTATSVEAFALELAGFLAARNPQVTSVRIAIEEKTWIRIKAGGEKHGSAFMQRGPDVHTTTVELAQGGSATITSGVKGLVVLKTSHSAFAGFKRDELTTLPETWDRLFGTEATIDWVYSAPPPADFRGTRTRIMDTLLTSFAHHDSLSVQQTLYAMAEAVLAAEPLVAELTLTMPNRHNIPVDLSRFAEPFKLDNPNMIFVPIDEPSGLIHARVTR